MLNQRAQQKNRCKTGREGGRQLKTKMETHTTRVPALSVWHFPSVTLGVSESKVAWLKRGECNSCWPTSQPVASQSKTRLPGMRKEPAWQVSGFPGKTLYKTANVH